MEILEKKIKKFMAIETHDYGSGVTSCSCDGGGNGYGYGSGYGSGSDYGSGYGYGEDTYISKINGEKIYMIDEIPSIIKHISRNIAKGYILGNDLTLKPCYIAKSNGKFAHGETIKEACKALEDKILNDLDIEEKIEKFKEKFKSTEKYPASLFYEWHHILTGSCEMGRKNFMKNHEIKENDEFTVREFIKLTENDFGGEYIAKLKKFY